MRELSSDSRNPLSFAGEREVDTFVEMLDKFERGEISSDAWRRFRLVHGTYGQRQDGEQMLRVKIPQGVLNVPQLHALAEVAERFSRGFAHITTRQNVQFHFVKLHDVAPAMRVLADAGLTTREACGNAVCNITACPYAGVSRDELFDVTPYAEALTRYLLRHPLSAVLPRKFKVAFEGCAEDHACTAINDLCWIARVDTTTGQPRRGFQLVVGGGTSILPTSARTLFEFVPGVSASISALALAGIPVTHRGVSSGFVMLSGSDEASFRHVIQTFQPELFTLVVLMGTGRRSAIVQSLLTHGWARRTPSALIVGVATPQMWAWRGDLDTLADVEIPKEAAQALQGDAHGRAR